jgi:catechol 2,3-dioxygenase-like lactoylglutathione lyase family enzyme
MPKFTQSRIVLASRNLAASKAWYREVLGFREEPIQADGWAFLERETAPTPCPRPAWETTVGTST